MEQEISVEENRRDKAVFYTYSTDHGELEVIYRPEVRWFGIANLDVERGFRRQGIAQRLARKALEDALQLEARLVYSAILSRECLDVMLKVFGPEAVTVKYEGTYTPEDEPERYDTEAWLRFQPE